MKSFKKAFTLIELLIVIVIIGILATIAIVNYNGASTKAKDTAVYQSLVDATNVANICNTDGNTVNLPADGTDICTAATGSTVTVAGKWPTPSSNSSGWAWDGTQTAGTSFVAKAKNGTKTISCSPTGCTKSGF